jgi:hypothetical protein
MADFQSAEGRTHGGAQRVGNPRDSRLEICATTLSVALAGAAEAVHPRLHELEIRNAIQRKTENTERKRLESTASRMICFPGPNLEAV